MARIKLVYLGGGSTRAAGTMASFMANGADFDGSEVVLVDLDPDRLELIRVLAQKMARARGLDIEITATTDRRLRSTGATRSSPPSARAASRRACTTSGYRSSTASSARRRRVPAASSWPCARSPCSGTCAPRWSRSAPTPGSSTTRTRSTSSPRRSPTTRRQGRLALRGADLLPGHDRRVGRARPGEAARDDGRPQPRLLGRRARLRRAGPTAALRRGLGAPPRRPDARAARPAPAPARGRDGRRAGRLLRVLLLHRRGARLPAREADHARRGHPRLVARLLAPLRGAGADRRPAARPRPLARRHPRARARDRRDGRDLQRQGRGAPRQRPERRRRPPGLPRRPRRRGARPLPPAAAST